MLGGNVRIAGRKTKGQLNVIQECNLHDLQLKSARGVRLSCLYNSKERIINNNSKAKVSMIIVPIRLASNYSKMHNEFESV